MTGIIRFRSLAEAIRQGYQVYDETRAGYLLRIMTARGWAMALCDHADSCPRDRLSLGLHRGER